MTAALLEGRKLRGSDSADNKKKKSVTPWLFFCGKCVRVCFSQVGGVMFKGGGSPPERWRNHGTTFQFFLKTEGHKTGQRVFFFILKGFQGESPLCASFICGEA